MRGGHVFRIYLEVGRTASVGRVSSSWKGLFKLEGLALMIRLLEKLI